MTYVLRCPRINSIINYVEMKAINRQIKLISKIDQALILNNIFK